jgi:hypothetical protein
MRATRISFVAASLLVAGSVGLGVGPAGAITNGEPDGNGHPFVGIMAAEDGAGNFLWRCTGTLMSPTVFLTAGHCTEAPAAHVELWFDADIDAGMPANGYPHTGIVTGTPNMHPQYDPNFFVGWDLGVVVLDAPVVMATYGALPALDSLDPLKPGKRTTFTSVGYGAQEASPPASSWKLQNRRLRMVATPRLVQINRKGSTGDYSMVLSNNANTGGACFGDSGGPNFLGSTNVIAGVTSSGNQNCSGTFGVYRIDRADDLAWLATFGLTPAP